MFIPFICLWIKQHHIFVYFSYGVFFAVYFTLVCCQHVRRTFPGNYLALLLFTLAFSYLSGAITCSYNTFSVLVTLVITAVTCLFVSLIALSTCVDFTRCTALFMVLSIALALFGISCTLVYLVFGYNKILHTVYGGVAACVFVLYLIYDTQVIVGGQSHELSPEEYIFGAVQLYMDVMNLFLIILGLIADRE
ncbi:hypothetical protein P879_04047 [Paragonimus westermani]|uniref:Bax inhibitor 1 n=1 Tax=Paragonimus westermani TaxID=34504 RepID=A0A8T0D5D5_9TREM|nr:hypothetical protein P879_04047 [Paragonimus westermani]